jgi:hypothetical protein
LRAGIHNYVTEQVAASHPQVVSQLLAQLGAWAWDCPDGLCSVDTYGGAASVCDSLEAYGAFGPWADLAPPPPPPSPAFRLEQGGRCLSSAQLTTNAQSPHYLTLGSCTSGNFGWRHGQYREILDPERGRAFVPTLISTTTGLCVHVNHHDQNNTCDATPATNMPVMLPCGHGNAFNFSADTGNVGELRNLNCPNWGLEGACLLSDGGRVIAGPCDVVGAHWIKHAV